MNDSNLIPVAHLPTEAEVAERDAALQAFRTSVQAHLDAGRVMTLGVVVPGATANDTTVNILTNAETAEPYMACLLGLVTTLGMVELGEGAEKLPPELLQAVAMSTGIKRLNEAVRAAFEAQGVPKPAAVTH